MRTPRLLTAFIIAAGLFAVAGCADVRNHLHALAADATDIVRADVSASFGTDMGAHVMLTEYLQLKSYSYEDVWKMGFGMRHIGTWMEDRDDVWFGGTPYAGPALAWRPRGLCGPDLREKIDAGLFDDFTVMGESPDEVGFGAHLFLVGFKVGVRPFELLDCLANLLLLDPSHDNLSWEMRKQFAEKRQAAKRRPAAEPKGPAED